MAEGGVANDIALFEPDFPREAAIDLNNHLSVCHQCNADLTTMCEVGAKLAAAAKDEE